MSDEPGFDHVMKMRVRNRTNPSIEKLAQVRGEAAHTRMRFTERLLLRHTLILGASGSGKTNHAFYVIRDTIAMRSKACFIVDVKREYRELDGIVQEDLRVLAVGDEPRVTFNPLIPPPGVDTEEWESEFIDVFTRAYGLSEPSRRILMDCLLTLHERSTAHPTLRELEGAVAEFHAGSSKEQNSQRSLESRLHVINMGKVGRSLNSDDALDIAGMEGRVTVFEIGAVRSLRDQRFLAELALAQLFLHDMKRAIKEEVPEETLKRLIVFEEAHRYLSEERPPQQRGERTLLELSIAEARRYGWGFIIVDQIPLLLSRYVWDNCGTVLAHRLANLDSYEIVKKALGGDPFAMHDSDARGDPLALRLPEDVAIFRRYVDPDVVAAGTGFLIVPRVRKAAVEDDRSVEQDGGTGRK